MKTREAFLLALAIYLFSLTSIGIVSKWVLFLAVWLSTGGTHWVYLFRHTCKRDFRLLSRGVRVLAMMAYVKYGDKNVVFMFRRVVKRHPEKVAFVDATNDKEWTFTDVEEYSNKVANYFLKEGYQKGDTVALFMGNCPEFVAIWIGLAKIGVIPAFINFNLRKSSLVHTIKVADCKAVICGRDLEDAVMEVHEELRASSKSNSFKVYQSRAGSESSSSSKRQEQSSGVDLDKALKSSSTKPEPESIRNSIHATDPLLYIYTSGTTGLPKAVIIKHIRQLFACVACHYMMGLTVSDTVYCYLPLYHSSGGQIGTASSLFFGAKTIIKSKFSASTFWKDCVKYNVTATQYIGEICRYLLASDKVPEERTHKVRIMFGNGLRPQIWEKFIKRFGIANIAEFYGATEGNSNMVNIENKVGCVGSIGVCFPDFLHNHLLPLFVIKVDAQTGEPIRDSDGFCINTEPDEPGEFIGKIVRGDPIKDFNGYREDSGEATKKKILTDVFQKGDIYFRSGDIIIKDEFGWLHFKDRIGDTFRWKGENVSTQEVEATVSNILELMDATSYGVQVPNTDGRAGMIAILAKDKDQVDLSKLYQGITDRLPTYARPLFVRLVGELHMTGTFKLKKNLLQEEGFDVTRVKDPMFFLQTKAKKFVPLTEELHRDITSGKLRL